MKHVFALFDPTSRPAAGSIRTHSLTAPGYIAL